MISSCVDVALQQANQLHREVERKDQKLERLERENASLTAQNRDFKEENRSLEKGLREVHDALKQEGILYTDHVILYSFLSIFKNIFRVHSLIYKQLIASCPHRYLIYVRVNEYL